MNSALPRIVFLCTGNSCRSQMAEAWCRSLLAGRCEVYSAGTVPTGEVHPWAVKAMSESGIDISGQRSKSIDELPGGTFDIAITVCDDACRLSGNRPPARIRLHWSFPDPARAEGTQQDIERMFRQVRDQIRERIEAEIAKL